MRTVIFMASAEPSKAEVTEMARFPALCFGPPPCVAGYSYTEHGAKMASVMPWMIFLSAGQIVARTPPI